MIKGTPGIAVALVDLREDNQRNREVIELAQSAVEVDGGLRRTQPRLITAIGERAIGEGEVGIETRLESRVADLLGQFEAARAGVDGAGRVQGAVEDPEV